MQPGKTARRAHDYTRHQTTTLFAALEIATGQVTAALKPKHRRTEFLGSYAWSTAPTQASSFT